MRKMRPNRLLLNQAVSLNASTDVVPPLTPLIQDQTMTKTRRKGRILDHDLDLWMTEEEGVHQLGN